MLAVRERPINTLCLRPSLPTQSNEQQKYNIYNILYVSVRSHFGSSFQPSTCGQLPASLGTMRVRKTMKKVRASPFCRLTPVQRGMIFMGFLQGMSLNDIACDVPKSDGSQPSRQAVSDTIDLAKANGGSQWDGVVSGDAGRPRRTTSSLDKQITRIVFRMRGSARVTATYIRKVLRAARSVAVRTVQRRIREAGLRWLRRRQKTLLSKAHKQERLEWVVFVCEQTSSMLAKWAYTDGTSFYLARTEEEHLDKQRAALGTHVWRAANGRDALYEDCVGPSSYAKAQGTCVRIWGLLFAGMLCVYVLPQGAVMNAAWYTWLIENKFRLWLDMAYKASTKVFLVQDHERSLWTEEPLDAMEDANIVLLDFPTSSQDLNPIEVAWREVKARLNDTMPVSFESRPQFIERLHRAVAWCNDHRGPLFKRICSSQKAWAKDVMEAKPRGGRTKH